MKKHATKKRVVAHAAKKRVSKTAASHTRTPRTKSGAHKTHQGAHTECCFWINNGPVVDSTEGLAQAIREMSDEQFAYHTKRNGNDFAAWIRDVFQCHICAQKLEKATTRLAMIRILAHCTA